jgi:hypothetical protein
MRAQVIYYMHVSPREFDRMKDNEKIELWRDLQWVREEEEKASNPKK